MQLFQLIDHSGITYSQIHTHVHVFGNDKIYRPYTV